MCNVLYDIYNFLSTDFFKINISELATIIGVVFTAISVWQIKKINEEQSLPFVSLYIDKDINGNMGIIYLKIKNFGKTPAKDISIPEIETPKESRVPVRFPNSIPYLAPGQEVTTIYLVGKDANHFKKQKGSVIYYSEKGKKLESKFSLNAKIFKGNTYSDSYIERISKSIANIDKNLER